MMLAYNRQHLLRKNTN